MCPDRDVFREDLHLEPEAAADVGTHDPHAGLRQTESVGKRRAHDRRRLIPGPHGQRLAVPVGENAARLEGRGRAAAVLERLAHDDRGEREGAVDVTVPVTALEQDLLRRERLVDGGHRGSRFPFDADQLSRVRRNVRIRRHHRRDRLTAKSGDAVRQRRPGGGDESGAVEARRERPGNGPQILRCDDRDHAGHGESGRAVDADDARVGVRTAHEAREQHARQTEVVEVAPAAGQEPRVLEPLDPHARIPQRRRGAGAHSPSRWNTRPSRSFG